MTGGKNNSVFRRIELNRFSLTVTGLMVFSGALSLIFNSLWSNVGYLLFSLLILVNYKGLISSLKEDLLLLIILTFFIIYYLVCNLFVANVDSESIVNIGKSILFIILFKSIKVKELYIRKMLLILGGGITILSLSIPLRYFGDLFIAYDHVGLYYFGNKNVYAPIIVIQIIACIYMYRSRYFRKLNVIMIIALFLALVSIQSRSNLVICIMILILWMFHEFNHKSRNMKLLTIMAFILGGLFLGSYINLFDIIESFILRSDYTTQFSEMGTLDSITSGRYSIIAEANHLLERNFLFSIWFDKDIISSYSYSKTGIHSLALRYLYYGGLIPFLIFVFFFLLILKDIQVINSKMKIYMIVYFLMISFMEPYAPFGPGFSYIYFWLLYSMKLVDGSNGDEKCLNSLSKIN